MDVHTVEAMLTFPSAFLIAVFDLDQCSFLFMSAFKRGGLASRGGHDHANPQQRRQPDRETRCERTATECDDVRIPAIS